MRRFINYCILFIYYANIADAFLTQYLINKGFAKEANPLMDWILGIHPLLFVFIKLLTGILFFYVCYDRVELKTHKALVIIGSLLYAGALFLHFRIVYLVLTL